MSDIVDRLQAEIEKGGADAALLLDAVREIGELKERSDALEKLFILLVRTSVPWDDDGNPGEAFPAFRERYQRVVHEAADLLGLELRSTITRTEPRT